MIAGGAPPPHLNGEVAPLDVEEKAAAEAELARLREEHRDLDTAIEAMVANARADHLQVQRLKKRKLVLKDRISQLEDDTLPDIIA
ncbi:YdcH family protein [Rhodobium gokarnense]|uniref:YdcH family protein n=1 Tax=Rhodobium gokarnense TaxID=364296 RepID=UPI002225AF06|nr:DUF465 domain-containing protein [Rhodobium gokarnense]